MKSKLTLNKLAIWLSCACIALAFIISCKKDYRSTEEADFPELKVFYEANQPTKESLFTNTKPIWGEVNKLKQGNMFIFEIALENPDRVGITSKEPSEQDIDNYQNSHSLNYFYLLIP